MSTAKEFLERVEARAKNLTEETEALKRLERLIKWTRTSFRREPRFAVKAPPYGSGDDSIILTLRLDTTRSYTGVTDRQLQELGGRLAEHLQEALGSVIGHEQEELSRQIKEAEERIADAERSVLELARAEVAS